MGGFCSCSAGRARTSACVRAPACRRAAVCRLKFRRPRLPLEAAAVPVMDAERRLLLLQPQGEEAAAEGVARLLVPAVTATRSIVPLLWRGIAQATSISPTVTD